MRRGYVRTFVSTGPSEYIKNKASNLAKEDTVYSFVPPSTSTKNNLSLVFDFSPIFNIFERLLSSVKKGHFPFFSNAGRRALLLPRDGEGPERRRVHPRLDGGSADLQRRLGHRAPGERDLRHPPLLRGRPIREFLKKTCLIFKTFSAIRISFLGGSTASSSENLPNKRSQADYLSILYFRDFNLLIVLLPNLEMIVFSRASTLT